MLPCTLAPVYVSASCNGEMIRSMVKRPMYIELFKGTGSMSRNANIIGFDSIVSLDNNPDCEADFVCDIADVGVQTHDFDKHVMEGIREGRIIIMTASPPCDQFSQMNTTGNRDILGAMEIVMQTCRVMSKYSDIWSLENPKTGLLWKQPFSEENFMYYHDVDYCAYGGVLRKSTRFAFSSEELKNKFKPCKCIGVEECQACFVDIKSGRKRHANMDKIPYHDRIAIPNQLCMSILYTMNDHVKEYVNVLADAVDKLIEEKLIRDKQRLESIASQEDNGSDVDMEGTVYQSHGNVGTSKYHIDTNNVVVYMCDPHADPTYLFSPYNLPITDVIDMNDRSRFRAFMVNTSKVVKFSSKLFHVMSGRFYQTTLDGKLQCGGSTETHIVVSEDDIFGVYTLNDKEVKNGTFRITPKKQQAMQEIAKKISVNQ